MAECWLSANWRPVAAAMAPPAVVAVGCGAGVALSASPWIRLFCGIGLGLSGVMLIGLGALLGPRLARDGDWLLVRLKLGPPLRVPLEKVEVFFFGQGPSMTGPKAGEDDDDLQTQTGNVVVRLAEAATDLHHRDVERRLGHWCDGYIVIRGTHCEPLTKEVMTRLNHQLREFHRLQREGSARV
ncbi:MAG: hypothetical protein KDB14_27525 [Planctomycetales bacterium]|nr:hypothetical protein [Planctomycetales bacterium]